jgi:2-amino-4-hydroxy-6-hydroxymethyldihydropteridine diphosphokinase
LNAAGSEDSRRVILGLGSNINPVENLIRALELLRQHLCVQQVSSAWESTAVGSDGPDFLNVAVWIETSLSLPVLKQEIIRPIEKQLGRVRSADKNAPRTIDIDILIDQEELVEPELWEYAFLAIPTAELLPDFTHPQTGEPLQQAAARLEQTSELKHRPEVVPSKWKGAGDCN